MTCQSAGVTWSFVRHTTSYILLALLPWLPKLSPSGSTAQHREQRQFDLARYPRLYGNSRSFDEHPLSADGCSVSATASKCSRAALAATWRGTALTADRPQAPKACVASALQAAVGHVGEAYQVAPQKRWLSCHRSRQQQHTQVVAGLWRDSSTSGTSHSKNLSAADCGQPVACMM